MEGGISPNVFLEKWSARYGADANGQKQNEDRSKCAKNQVDDSLLAASLKEKCFLLENRRVAIHEMSQGPQIVLIKEGNGKLGLKKEVSVALVMKSPMEPKPTAPLIPNALIVRHLNSS